MERESSFMVVRMYNRGGGGGGACCSDYSQGTSKYYLHSAMGLGFRVLTRFCL